MMNKVEPQTSLHLTNDPRIIFQLLKRSLKTRIKKIIFLYLNLFRRLTNMNTCFYSNARIWSVLGKSYTGLILTHRSRSISNKRDSLNSTEYLQWNSRSWSCKILNPNEYTATDPNKIGVWDHFRCHHQYKTKNYKFI